MFALVLGLAVTTALVARLVSDIRQNRPVTPPRSHWHELDGRLVGRIPHV